MIHFVCNTIVFVALKDTDKVSRLYRDGANMP